MDILLPDLVWIGGRCYRVNEEYSNETVGADIQEETDLYGSCTLTGDDDNDLEYEIENTENGKFRTAFHVPQFYYSQIIGSKGAVRKRIEMETKTHISVPKQGQEGSIIITGSTEKGVITARRRIDLIVVASRNKQPFTHFLSVPFNSTDIKKKIIEFKSDILSRFGTTIPESLFQVPEKLHLTLGTLCLMDNEDRACAAELLNECKQYIIDPIIQEYGSLKLHLAGVEIMNDDPTAVDVLYARVHDDAQWANEGIFQNMADQIVERFAKKGLLQKQTEKVKLHVTLMNSLFGNDNEDQTRRAFDASVILKSYEDFEFGTQDVQVIHLSQRYSTGCDGYYQSTMTVNC